MNNKSKSWLALALLQFGVAGNAMAATVFTDRTSFEAALATYSIENFESYATVGTADPYFNQPDGLTSLALNDFSLSATPRAIKIWDAYHDGSHNTTTGDPNYSNFLYLDTDNRGIANGTTVGSSTTISLNNQADAFGFEYTGVFEPGTTFTVTIGSTTFDLSLNSPEDSPLFWGVLGLGSFTDIMLTTSLDSGYGVDDVIFGTAVPLPPALWLFGSGLLALAGGATNRKTPS